MRILVTGATGFVGACLTRRLVEQGYDTHIFIRESSNLWRLQDVLQQVTCHVVDLRDFTAVTKSIRNIKPTTIYHLATYGGFSFQRDRTAVFTANFLGTVNLLQACETVGFDCFVNTGSSSEYGLKLQPMSENTFLAPLGDYGVSKAATTLFCRSEAVQKQLPIVTLRLFSPYGNWDDPQRFIPYCIKSMLKGEEIKIATPTAVRDYIFIEDVLDFYQLIARYTEQCGNIYNVGSGTQITIGQVGQCIADIIGVKATFHSVETQKKPTESPVWVADISNARALGWEPRTNIKTGIKKTIFWMRQQMHLYP